MSAQKLEKFMNAQKLKKNRLQYKLEKFNSQFRSDHLQGVSQKNCHPNVGCVMPEKDVQHRDTDSERMAQHNMAAQNTYYHTNPRDHTSLVKQIN